MSINPYENYKQAQIFSRVGGEDEISTHARPNGRFTALTSHLDRGIATIEEACRVTSREIQTEVQKTWTWKTGHGFTKTWTWNLDMKTWT